MKCDRKSIGVWSGEKEFCFVFLFTFYRDPIEETASFFETLLLISTCQMELQHTLHGHGKDQHTEAGRAECQEEPGP